MFEKMINSWKDSTAKQMRKHLIVFKTDFPKLYKALLSERNNNWIPNLEDYLKTNEVEFVVVGALHLYGFDGILQQMKNRGY